MSSTDLVGRRQNLEIQTVEAVKPQPKIIKTPPAAATPEAAVAAQPNPAKLGELQQKGVFVKAVLTDRAPAEEPPKDPAAQKQALIQQLQQPWQDVLAKFPDFKQFQIPLQPVANNSQGNLLTQVRAQGFSLMPNAAATKGFDKYLGQFQNTIRTMEEIVNVPKAQAMPGKWAQVPFGAWTIDKLNQRFADNVANIGQKYPPGTKFQLLTYDSRTADPRLAGNGLQAYSGGHQIGVAAIKPDGTTEYHLINQDHNFSNNNPSSVKVTLNPNGIIASVDATHLVAGGRPATLGATVNVAAAEIETHKTEAIFNQNYDKFVTATFAPHAHLRGDAPRTLQGTDLRNEIGVAMKFQPNNVPHTAAQQKALQDGNWDFYAGAQREAINKVEEQIKQAAGGDAAKVTVLPTILQTKGENGEQINVEVPLFRVQTAQGDKFVDTAGRTYNNLQDWKDNNKLPEGKVTIPKDGHLTTDANGRPQYETMETPEGGRWGWKVLDGIAMVGGIVVGIAAVIGTGGAALPFIGAGLAAYGLGRSGAELADRHNHGQTLNPLQDSEARAAWIGLGANAIGFAALGTAARAAQLGIKANVGLLATSRALNIGAQVTDTFAIANQGYALATGWEKLSAQDRLAAIGQMAFWGSMTAVSAKQAGGLKNLYGLGDLNATFKGQRHEWKAEMLRGSLTPAAQKEFDAARAKFPSTEAFLKSLNETNGKIPKIVVEDVVKRYEAIAKSTADAAAKQKAYADLVSATRSKLSPEAQKAFDAERAGLTNETFLENLAGKNRGAGDVKADDIIKRFENIAARKASETQRQAQALAQEDAARALVNKPEFLNSPEIKGALAKPKDQIISVRGEIAVEVTRQKLSIDYPAADGYQILKGVRVYEDTGFKTLNDWRAAHPGKDGQGLEVREGRVVQLKTDIDLLVIKQGEAGRPAEIVHLEQIKSGANDKAVKAREQMQASVAAFESGAKGTKIFVETGDGANIAGQLNLNSANTAQQVTRGPEGKTGFDQSVGLTTAQMEKLAKEIAK